MRRRGTNGRERWWFAQSRGEWPGVSMTFWRGFGGGWVCVGGSCSDDRCGGTPRDDEDGGTASEDEEEGDGVGRVYCAFRAFAAALTPAGVRIGADGGGIRDGGPAASLGPGSGGGAMAPGMASEGVGIVGRLARWTEFNAGNIGTLMSSSTPSASTAEARPFPLRVSFELVVVSADATNSSNCTEAVGVVGSSSSSSPSSSSTTSTSSFPLLLGRPALYSPVVPLSVFSSLGSAFLDVDVELDAVVCSVPSVMASGGWSKCHSLRRPSPRRSRMPCGIPSFKI
ncbi:hypothetical protein ABW21_db0201764 [Orbilia brochopaga]|nr:hypothetical protein ABW21_db0201764 [Drechslerella brochopaga]